MPAETARPEIVRLGAIELKLDPSGTFAREIAVAGEEVFRGIGFVARDANWGTPALPATVSISRAPDAIEARANGTLDQPAGDLDWQVVWTLTRRGVEARATFSSRRGFSTNRTGFVVLHSLPASRGRPVAITHPDGKVEATRFPDLISPHQPFFDIAAMEYETSGGHQVALAFEGEVFEIEDQRNWTDASYKTYCRPLRLPYPYRIEPGRTVEQIVKLTMEAASKARPIASAAPVAVTTTTLPLLGTHLPPGPIAAGQPQALGQLGPGFVAIELALDDPDWIDQLRDKLRLISGPVRLDLRGAEPAVMQEAVGRLAPLLDGVGLVGLSLWNSDEATLGTARAVLPKVPIGSGTGAFFTELNRMTSWPSADYLTWTSNPTVHGFDDDTIGETTEVLADVMRSAKAKLPGRCFQIGPMTLGLRFNPNATSPEGRRQSADPDSRQGGLIAAAWLAATFAGFLDDSVQTLSFFEPSGPKGLVDANGGMTPSGYLFSRLSALSGCRVEVLRWNSSPRSAGLLLHAPDARALCLVHCRHDRARLTLPPGPWKSAEALAIDGFMPWPEAPGARVDLDGFSVLWLT